MGAPEESWCCAHHTSSGISQNKAAAINHPARVIRKLWPILPAGEDSLVGCDYLDADSVPDYADRNCRQGGKRRKRNFEIGVLPGLDPPRRRNLGHAVDNSFVK